ncbi:cytoplasmic protein [Moniliophthora roreri MCA 2997]|uniref:Cytoplasmic protein n=1 Tax=Moniliophthora roreri (strain MCA 2997) TaxID=1381753 RepID=V2XAM1_MONRO|nr:cytoplasmic protein [Moniliophthora roreri MCA 2997]
MSIQLPPELLQHILLEIREDKPSLKSFSLVCSTFLFMARPHLFHTIRLRPAGVSRFLRLCDHPLQTISSAGVQVFALVQEKEEEKDLRKSRALNDLLTWCSPDEERTLPTILSNLKRLSFTWTGSWMLSEEGEMRLREFQLVTELSLSIVAFHNYGEILRVIDSFPSLEALTLVKRFKQDDETESHLGQTLREVWSHPDTLQTNPLTISLKTISLQSYVDAWLIRALAPCRTLREFQCHYNKISHLTVERASAIGGLLSGAGSLESFSFTIQEDWSIDDNTGLVDRFHRYINLTRNPKLRKVTLSVRHKTFPLHFFEHLKEANIRIETISLHRLSNLVAENESEFDYDRLDAILQYPTFSRLREVILDVFIRFGPESVAGQSPRKTYPRPNENSSAVQKMETKMAIFRSRLPLCERRGILKLQEEYRFSWGSD